MYKEMEKTKLPGSEYKDIAFTVIRHFVWAVMPSMFMNWHNLKCKVYEDRIITGEPFKKANEFTYR